MEPGQAKLKGGRIKVKGGNLFVWDRNRWPAWVAAGSLNCLKDTVRDHFNPLSCLSLPLHQSELQESIKS